MLKDKLDRPMTNLRISVIDACNFRCDYCMPANRQYTFLQNKEKLRIGELTRLVNIFTSLGVERVRLTGGEPLLRHNIVKLVHELNQCGLKDIALTTNGYHLNNFAEELFAAGMNRITVSLDSMNPEVFSKITGGKGKLEHVLKGIDAALKAGFQPVKINTVLRKGLNEESILPLAEYARKNDLSLRFIEFMDVGTRNGWSMKEVISSDDVLKKIHKLYPVEQVNADFYGEVAARYKFVDGKGELGFISSVTKPFCSSCTRVRLSSDGKLYNCLFATEGIDLRDKMRQGATDEDIRDIIIQNWNHRENRYSEERSEATEPPEKVEMNYIGG